MQYLCINTVACKDTFLAKRYSIEPVPSLKPQNKEESILTIYHIHHEDQSKTSNNHYFPYRLKHGNHL